jgi:multisubunit Na+/H+ antiporter MnhG subunit
MLSAIIAIILSAIIGGVAYIVTNSNIPTGTIKVSKREFILGLIISTLFLLLFAPLTEHIIINNRESYKEYFNGYETATNTKVVMCERDGDCDYTYSCDPYIVVHHYEDSKGHEHTYYTTEYHHCPYLTEEYHYIVATTLGDYPIGGAYAGKVKKAWRSGENISGSIPTGPPSLWSQAKNRIDSGKPGGVTKLHNYKNFFLASDQTILHAYSDDISQYLKKGLLPPVTKNYSDPIYNEYMADKFSTVKFSANTKAWNESLNRLNGYLGKELQGDIHMVAVDKSVVPNPDDYSQALFAYWKSPLYFHKYALSKNAVVVVVGVDDSSNKIAWARASGGLPTGNEALFLDIQNNLTGVDFDPDVVIGIPHKNNSGILTNTVYGIHKFKRPCMECIQNKNKGYGYLIGDIAISGWQRFWIVFFGIVISSVMWTVFLFVDDTLGGMYY